MLILEKTASSLIIEPYVWHNVIVILHHEKKRVPRLLPHGLWERSLFQKSESEILLPVMLQPTV
jgi:hypothetical protein